MKDEQTRAVRFYTLAVLNGTPLSVFLDRNFDAKRSNISMENLQNVSFTTLWPVRN